MLVLIVPKIVGLIVENHGIDEVTASRKFYESKVYSLLEEEDTKLWHLSPLMLFHMYDDRTYLNTIIYIRDGFEDNHKMSDKEKLFYCLLLQTFEKTDYVTTKMMSEVSRMPESTTRRYLNKFCDLEVIKFDGKNKWTKYYLS